MVDLSCDADEVSCLQTILHYSILRCPEKTKHFRAVSPFRPRSPVTPAPYIPPDTPLFAGGKSKISKKKNTTKVCGPTALHPAYFCSGALSASPSIEMLSDAGRV